MPVVIISGHGNIEIAVSAIKQGAYDFIEKPFNIRATFSCCKACYGNFIFAKRKQRASNRKIKLILN